MQPVAHAPALQTCAVAHWLLLVQAAQAPAMQA